MTKVTPKQLRDVEQSKIGRSVHSVIECPIQEKPYRIPLLAFEDGEISHLALKWARYINETTTRLYHEHKKAVRSLGLLYDYYKLSFGNKNLTEEMMMCFLNDFVIARIRGTVRIDGKDESGLLWRGIGWGTLQEELKWLNHYSRFISNYYKMFPINPIDTKYSLSVKDAYQKELAKEKSFFVHLDDARKEHDAYWSRHRLRLAADGDGYGAVSDVVAFPYQRFADLITDGCRRIRVRSTSLSASYHELYAIREQMAFILQGAGSLRESELAHIFIDDVTLNKADGTANVIVGHPVKGAIRWKRNDEWVVTTRAKFLRERYGRLPRNWLERDHPEWAGWKYPLLDKGKPSYYMQVHWISPTWGKKFWELYKHYVLYVHPIVARDISPYLFVNLKKCEQTFGHPMRLRSYRQRYDDCATRIGLIPSKHRDGTPHGLRHMYGFLAKKLRIPPSNIQIMMHHKSILSQQVYGKPTAEDINKEISRAWNKIDTADKLQLDIIMNPAERLQILDLA